MSSRFPQIAVSFILCSMLAAFGASAQERVASADQGAAAREGNTDMQILADKIRADKKALVAANLELTEEQAAKFWPIYDAYQADLQKINQRTLSMVKSYADAYNDNSLTDEKARQLISEAIQIREDQAAMQKKYAQQLEGAVPTIEAARYLQIENKIRAVVDYNLADTIPLAE
ncbi:MAG TPA: hypothetical protein VFV10_09670 [Gammaproteobacteria bacterium]|nr:hypothetical protein [Gammaproteobacteria bacterium]